MRRPMPTADTARWQRFRFALGMAQMTGATLALALLVTTGLTAVSIFAALLATLLTAISMLLRERFRNR